MPSLFYFRFSITQSLGYSSYFHLYPYAVGLLPLHTCKIELEEELILLFGWTALAASAAEEKVVIKLSFKSY